MAKQKGVIRLVGTIGGVSFYKSKDGYLAREKGGVPKERIMNDPAFQRTRENGSEFGRAGKASKTLRDALKLLLQKASDNRVVSRLTTEMLKAIQADTTNGRGDRTIMDGDISLLNGFDFNINSKLKSSLYTGYTPSIDREAGTLSVTIPEFVPEDTIVYPQGATHLKIVVGGGLVDFENESHEFSKAESAEIEISANPKASFDLNTNVTAASTGDLFLVLGIQFLQEVNGSMYSLKNGTYNALAIVALDRS